MINCVFDDSSQVKLYLDSRFRDSVSGCEVLRARRLK
jgi:hypothetical protein